MGANVIGVGGRFLLEELAVFADCELALELGFGVGDRLRVRP